LPNGEQIAKLTRMKQLFTVFTTILAGIVLTGCSESPSTNDGSALSSAPSVTDTASAEIKKTTANAADEVSNEVKKQAGEIATEVQKQAKAVYEDLSQKLIENTKAGANDLMKKISADLEQRVKNLGESVKNNETVMGQLDGALQALLNNKDINAVEAFNDVAAAKLTPEQTTLAKDVYNAGAAFVTERNFSSLEGLDSDVAKLSNAVWQGNYTEALQPLQNIWNKGALTNEQKDLLGTVFDQYLPGWQEKAEVVNQGLDAIKKFGQ